VSFESCRKLSVYSFRFSGSIVRENNLILRHGICVPASCSADRTVDYFNSRYLSQADLIGSSARCQTNDAITFDTLDIIAIILFTIFALLLLTSTVYDVVMINDRRKPLA